METVKPNATPQDAEQAVVPEQPERPQAYIGAKIIKAVPMERDNMPGYQVIYPDGYVSWSPKETFETAYRRITPGEKALIQE